MTRDEIKELAEFDFMNGMSISDIASKYEQKKTTISSWRTRGDWVKRRKEAERKAVQGDATTQRTTTHDNAKRNAGTRNVKIVTKRMEDEVDEGDLNSKQKAFVKEYLRTYNATVAYQNVYGVSKETAFANGSRLLSNARVREEVEYQKARQLKLLDISVQRMLIDLSKEAVADIGDFVNFASHDELIIDETTGLPALDKDDNPITRHVSQVWLKDKDAVDTSLIKKVSVGKDGVQLELHDRSKARDELLKRLTPDPATELKLRKLRAEAEIAEAKAKLLTGDDNVEDENVKALIEGMRSIANSMNGAADEDD